MAVDDGYGWFMYGLGLLLGTGFTMWGDVRVGLIAGAIAMIFGIWCKYRDVR